MSDEIIEFRFPVQPYAVIAKCKKMDEDILCEGELRYTGEMFLTEPPQLLHKCIECGAKYHLSEKYPKVAYEAMK